MMRKIARTSLARFSASPKGLPYYNDSEVETPELIREDIQPEGKWPYLLHKFYRLLVKSKVPAIREHMANFTSLRKLDNGNLYVDYPKLTPNSVWLYHGSHDAEKTRRLVVTTSGLVGPVLLTSFNPAFHFFAFSSLFIFVFSVMRFQKVQRLVVRMDYLPNIKKICVTKIGLFGILKTSFWELNEFKSLSGFQDRSLFPLFWRKNKFVDPHTLYQNTRTGEKLFFELNGLWNWEGISHPDLQNHQIVKDPEYYLE